MAKKNQQLIRIRLRSFDQGQLDRAIADIIETARRTGAVVVGPIPLPTKKEIHTVLRSPHVDRKSREQFQLVTHTRLIELHNPPVTTIESLKNINIPAGVDIRVKAKAA